MSDRHDSLLGRHRAVPPPLPRSRSRRGMAAGSSDQPAGAAPASRARVRTSGAQNFSPTRARSCERSGPSESSSCGSWTPSPRRRGPTPLGWRSISRCEQQHSRPSATSTPPCAGSGEAASGAALRAVTRCPRSVSTPFPWHPVWTMPPRHRPGRLAPNGRRRGSSTDMTRLAWGACGRWIRAPHAPLLPTSRPLTSASPPRAAAVRLGPPFRELRSATAHRNLVLAVPQQLPSRGSAGPGSPSR